MAGTITRVLAAAMTVVAMAAQSAAQSPAPVPRPFPGSAPPGSGGNRPADPPPTAPAPGTAAPAAPAPAAAPVLPGPDAPPADLPVYPTAEFLESFDAGQGQRYYLYGTNALFSDIVTYYRTVLKNGGREIYRAPATQQFDLGRYDDERMAYPPSVVVKDYTWNNSAGYLHVSGTTEKRYRTIIQIVPAGPSR